MRELTPYDVYLLGWLANQVSDVAHLADGARSTLEKAGTVRPVQLDHIVMRCHAMLDEIQATVAASRGRRRKHGA